VPTGPALAPFCVLQLLRMLLPGLLGEDAACWSWSPVRDLMGLLLLLCNGLDAGVGAADVCLSACLRSRCWGAGGPPCLCCSEVDDAGDTAGISLLRLPLEYARPVLYLLRDLQTQNVRTKLFSACCDGLITHPWLMEWTRCSAPLPHIWTVSAIFRMYLPPVEALLLPATARWPW
jgi:hypothetical protein